MAQPTDGQLITDSAIGSFQDPTGKKIEFEKQKDGSYTAKECITPLGFDEDGKETGKVKYNYGLSPKGEFLQVSVSKQRIYTEKQKEEALATGEILPGTNEGPIPEKDLKNNNKNSKKGK